MRSARALLVALLAAGAALAQFSTPVITSLDAFGAGTNAPGGPTVTATAPGFHLRINGTGLPTPADDVGSSVQWLAQGQTTPTILTSLTLSSTGTEIRLTIPSGLVATAGTAEVRVLVSYASAPQLSNPATITIAPPPTLLQLPGGTVLVPYAAPLVTGGAVPYIFSGLGLPPGFSFTSAGLLSGTPSAAGAFSIFAQVFDAFGALVDGIRTLNIALPPAPAILTTALPTGTTDTPYYAALAATGGTPPYTWSYSGNLPPGVTLASNGILSGTPTEVGTYAFSARLEDSAQQRTTRTLSITVVPGLPPLTITGSLLAGTVGVAYAQVMEASGGQPPYTWSITGLPPGLAASNDSISGTPTTAGSYLVTVSVSDSARGTTGTTMTLVVRPPRLAITTGALAAGTVGEPYSQPFTATGGRPPYTWSATGNLPAGLTVSPAGVLTGTATAAGTFAFTVHVADSAQETAARGYSVTMAVPSLAITTTSLAGGTAGTAYSATLEASGGVPPYRWSVNGLPAGLGANSATGVISGTPRAEGTATVTAEVTDSRGNTVSRSFELAIAAPPLTITTTSPLAAGTAGTAYSQTFTAQGGTPPYRWSAVAGWAGGGLALGSDGVLSGTPREAGTFTVFVQAADSRDVTATREFSLTIAPPAFAITTTALPAGTVGAPYSATLAATGNVGAVTWSAASLPAGLSLQGDTIAGTPTAPGTFSVTVQAGDAGGRSVSRALTLAIGLPPAPGVNFTGVPDVSDPARQPTLQLGLAGTYPVAISGRVTLAFAPEVGGDDPAVQFSTGGRSVAFTVPAGANLATFPVPALGLQTGTVAGIITLTVTLEASGTDITPDPPPSRTIRINRMPPVITEVRATRTSTGFDVVTTGYATTREVTQAIFRFSAAAGANLQTTEQSMTVESTFTRWYQDAASVPHGSRFSFTQSFTVTGEMTAVASVTVTLSNRQGNSQAVTANVP